MIDCIVCLKYMVLTGAPLWCFSLWKKYSSHPKYISVGRVTCFSKWNVSGMGTLHIGAEGSRADTWCCHCSFPLPAEECFPDSGHSFYLDLRIKKKHGKDHS